MKTRWCAIWLVLVVNAGAGVVEVGSEKELHNALLNLQAGTTLKISPGSYRGGFSVRGVERLVVEAADPIFDLPSDASVDIGIVWGLLEHFPGATKAPLLRKMRDFIRPGGFQISSAPRDSPGNRLFYRAFADEVNFG